MKRTATRALPTLCVLGLLTWTHHPALADSLRGRVLDPSGAAVGQVTLRLSDRETGQLRQTTSTEGGTYQFIDIPEGTYLIETTRTGQLAVSRQIHIEGDQALDLELEFSGTSVEVLVTASGTPQSVVEVGKALDVVTSQDIDLRDELSIAEAVRNIPGVRVQVQEGPGSLTTLQTRGLRIYDTAVLIDGMRFRDAASLQGDATAFLETMTTLDTDRIEFLRGSGSSLYGTHAMAGVMNIISRRGGGAPHAEFRAEGGGLGLIRSLAGVTGGLGQDHLTYSGRISHLNVTKGVRDGTPYRNTSSQGSVAYGLTRQISVTGRVWYAGDYLSSTESPAFPSEVLANFPQTGPVDAIPLSRAGLELFERQLPFDTGRATFVPGQMDRDGRRVGSFLTGNFTFQHELTPDTAYRIAYQGVHTNRRFTDGPARGGPFEPQVGTEGEYSGTTDTLQARLDATVGTRHQLTGGYEFEHERYEDFARDQGPVPFTSRLRIEQNSHSVFLQDQVRLLDSRLIASAAARTQFFELGTPSFSGAVSPYEGMSLGSPPRAYTGDASLAYFMEESQTKFRAHVGNSYRAPSPYERLGGSFSSFSGTFDYWGDPRLRSERSISLDAGVDQWLFGSRVQLGGTFFYTNLQETIIFDFANFPAATDPFGRFGGYRNSGGGISRGVEISTRLSPGTGTDIQLGYTFTNSDSRTPTIGSDFFETQGISDHMITLTATRWVTRRFNVTFDLFAASDYSLSPFGAGGRQVVFDGPIKGDIVGTYELGFGNDRAAELYVKVENVFNQYYYEDGFLGPGATSLGGIRIRY